MRFVTVWSFWSLLHKLRQSQGEKQGVARHRIPAEVLKRTCQASNLNTQRVLVSGLWRMRGLCGSKAGSPRSSRSASKNQRSLEAEVLSASHSPLLSGCDQRSRKLDLVSSIALHRDHLGAPAAYMSMNHMPPRWDQNKTPTQQEKCKETRANAEEHNSLHRPTHRPLNLHLKQTQGDQTRCLKHIQSAHGSIQTARQTDR